MTNMTIDERLAALEVEVRMLRGLLFGVNADGTPSEFVTFYERGDIVIRRRDDDSELQRITGTRTKHPEYVISET
jgi:hypothetical protein